MNTNQQTVHQMGFGINEMVKQATGRESVSSIDMDWVSVEQLARYIYGSGSGDVVSFDTNIPDAIDSLIAYITAVQDLHGYDNPWPAGGGKNYINVTADTTTTRQVTFTVNKDAGGNVVSIAVKGTATGGNAYFNADIAKTYESGSYILTGVTDGSAAFFAQMYDVTDSQNGTQQTDADGVAFSPTAEHEYRYNITVTSGTNVDAVVYPMLRLASVTDATFAPYSNICPITGWTGCNVTQCGKNILPGFDSGLWKSCDTASWNISNIGNTITFPVTISANQYNNVPCVKVFLKPGKYAISGNPLKYILIDFYDSTNTKIGSVGQRFESGSFTAPDHTVYANIALSNFERVSAVTLKTTDEIQLEMGESITAFEEYQGEVYAFTFPAAAGTVYGGTLDVLSGVLTVDRASKTIYLSASNVSSNATNTAGKVRWNISVNLSDASIPSATNKLCGALFDNAVEIAADSTYTRADTGIAIRNSTLLVYYSPVTEEMTKEQFLAFIGSTLQIVYPLAEPATYQLTAQEVTALFGANNIFADTGNVSVQYKVKEDLV